jgi:opacity protein-like surface antigen
VAVSFVACAGAASAQDSRVEITGNAAWSLSDGVTFSGIRAGDGNVYDTIEPADAFAWGLQVGIFATPNVEVGALFDRQSTTLDVGGTSSRSIGDMNLDNYHGYVAYNFGEPDARIRPYVLLGAGVTNYGSVPFSVGGFSGETEGNSQFSTTWGAGLKIYPSPRLGLKLGVRWTPTYIKSDATGWWCDPYWGCYVTGDAQYANQFQFGGGLMLRF